MSDSSKDHTSLTIFSSENFKEIALKFQELYFLSREGMPSLICCPKSNQFIHWKDGKYEEAFESWIKSQISYYLETVGIQKVGADDLKQEVRYIKNNKNNSSEVLSHLKSICINSIGNNFISGIKSQWLYDPDKTLPDASLIIPMQNCLLDINEFMKGKDDKLPPLQIAKNCMLRQTPRFYNNWVLPCKMNQNDYGREYPRKFLDFLKSIFNEEWEGYVHRGEEGECECIQLVLEWIGYMLTEDTSYQKILCLVGEAGSGKGTIARCFYEILHLTNCVTPHMKNFASRYGFQSWVGKKAAIFTDAQFPAQDRTTIETNILTVSGQDPVEIDGKFLHAIQAVLPTKIVIISNEMPEFRNNAAAFKRRTLLIPFSKSISQENLIPNIEKTFLPEELPQIIWVCLDAYYKLKRRKSKDFIQPKEGMRSLARFNDEQNTIRAFVEEKCKRGPEHFIEKESIYKHYVAWCKDKDYDVEEYLVFCKKMNRSFGKDIFSAERGSQGKIKVFSGVNVLNPFVD